MYVRGLKERSDVVVASTPLRPCQLWSTVSGKEGMEEDDESQGCLLKASLSVAFRLGGRSREESILLLCSQSHVPLLLVWFNR